MNCRFIYNIHFILYPFHSISIFTAVSCVTNNCMVVCCFCNNDIISRFCRNNSAKSSAHTRCGSGGGVSPSTHFKTCARCRASCLYALPQCSQIYSGSFEHSTQSIKTINAKNARTSPLISIFKALLYDTSRVTLIFVTHTRDTDIKIYHERI